MMVDKIMNLDFLQVFILKLWFTCTLNLGPYTVIITILTLTFDPGLGLTFTQMDALGNILTPLLSAENYCFSFLVSECHLLQVFLNCASPVCICRTWSSRVLCCIPEVAAMPLLRGYIMWCDNVNIFILPFFMNLFFSVRVSVCDVQMIGRQTL